MPPRVALECVEAAGFLVFARRNAGDFLEPALQMKGAQAGKPAQGGERQGLVGVRCNVFAHGDDGVGDRNLEARAVGLPQHLLGGLPDVVEGRDVEKAVEVGCQRGSGFRSAHPAQHFTPHDPASRQVMALRVRREHLRWVAARTQVFDVNAGVDENHDPVKLFPGAFGLPVVNRPRRNRNDWRRQCPGRFREPECHQVVAGIDSFHEFGPTQAKPGFAEFRESRLSVHLLEREVHSFGFLI